MQNHTSLRFIKKRNTSSLEAVTARAFATNPNSQFDDLIVKKQLEILEDAISRYNRLEEVKAFTKSVLEDINTVTPEDIENALKIEEMALKEKESQVKLLLDNKNFLSDVLEDKI